ncbi:sulfotransferase 1C2-like [Ylistrum balloti]|uniref:sulfotransferase 1C2-like n=1 Tax=Ylistrum balloti TaxID=509963 RepID=UPI002905D573|nr:sulfotransferase 1C2-like [Ylistrum balloti]
MELVSITDEDNNKYFYKRYDGYAFNTLVLGNVRDQLSKISKMKCRSEDVLIGVFPKSGTHWLYNTVMMLRTGTLKYYGTPTLLQFQEISTVDEMQTPRTFGSHLRFRFLPDEMKLGTGKVITITRNLKDLVVSVYHMLRNMEDIGYQGTFDGFLKRFVTEECFLGNGSWFSWIKDMEEWNSPNLLCLSYEDFKNNTYENVVKLAKFLELDHNEDFLRKVEQNISFDKLKEQHNIVNTASDRWEEITEDGRLPIYRKGQIGEWKNTFIVAQSEWFDKICKYKIEEMSIKTKVN